MMNYTLGGWTYAISAKSPKKVGARPWKIKYEVRVKFISVLDTLYSAANCVKAGKYMFALRGEKKPPHAARTVTT
jgi:hypothetical protein